jgi:hypothetical protein
MLARTLVKPCAIEDAAVHVLKPCANPRAAGYAHSNTLGWVHFHKEMNYRKTPLFWQAYSNKNMDCWAAWQTMGPVRHVETKAPGMWFGAGHMSKRHWGFLMWRVGGKWFLSTGAGFCFGIFVWIRRMALNGFQVKNAGAVTGD